MSILNMPSGFKKIGSSCVGKPYGHVPGHGFHDVDVTVGINGRGTVYRVAVEETSGSCQGHDEVHHRSGVSARANTIKEAAAEAKALAIEAGMEMKYLTPAVCEAVDEAHEAEEEDETEEE